MKALINAIVAILEAAITNGEITATRVWKGFGTMPENLPIESYPYITIDEQGERTESPAGSQTQIRYFSVLIECGVYVADIENSLDNILDLSEQIKVVLEKESSRQLDGMQWGVTIKPFQAQGDPGIYRGRQVTIEYRQIEDIYLDY